MEDPEDIATGDERALEEYLEERGEVSIDTISQMIAERQIFLCYFGAALKLQGVQELLDGVGKYVGDNVWPIMIRQIIDYRTVEMLSSLVRVSIRFP